MIRQCGFAFAAAGMLLMNIHLNALMAESKIQIKNLKEVIERERAYSRDYQSKLIGCIDSKPDLDRNKPSGYSMIYGNDLQRVEGELYKLSWERGSYNSNYQKVLQMIRRECQ